MNFLFHVSFINTLVQPRFHDFIFIHLFRVCGAFVIFLEHIMFSLNGNLCLVFQPMVLFPANSNAHVGF